jgi:hypothetical protein
MSGKTDKLGQKSMQAGQEWSQELQGFITKYKEDTLIQSTYSVTKPNK